MNGTYAIRIHTSKDEFENNTLVLKQDGDLIRGLLAEFLYRPVPMTNGKSDGNQFSFTVPPFITIFGDVFLSLKGEITGNEISGTVNSPFGKAAFTGKRISDKTPGL